MKTTEVTAALTSAQTWISRTRKEVHLVHTALCSTFSLTMGASRAMLRAALKSVDKQEELGLKLYESVTDVAVAALDSANILTAAAGRVVKVVEESSKDKTFEIEFAKEMAVLQATPAQSSLFN